MSSILKVDQIQLSNGNTPTAGDLGLNDTGTVLQTKTIHSQGANFSTSSQTFVTSGLSFTVTPKATNSKIIINTELNFWFGSVNINDYFRGAWFRGSTNLATASTEDTHCWQTTNIGGATGQQLVNFNLVDTPNTTSPVTYTLYVRTHNGNSMSMMWSGQFHTLILQEIAG